MNDSKSIIGVDLGTTHCVMAYTRADSEEGVAPDIRLFRVPQLVGPGEVKALPLLPSFLFLPGAHESSGGSYALPWDASSAIAVGEFARRRGAEVPSRLVSSSKSWLCHHGVDRTEPILPWDAPEEVRRVSPVEASACFLRHLRDAWNHEMAGDDPSERFEAQEVFLTVPASFDAVARELTVRAAQSVGIENPILLEEPQAAFYAWINAHGEVWRKRVSVGETILVCDLGGGTTDFSLIRVTQEEGELALRRVAVGDHLLLGGDNMDIALAYSVRARLAQRNVKLDNWQFRALWQSCRAAKERLLSDNAIESEPVVILGRGSSLIGGTIRTELTRAEVETILMEGFFPVVERNELPRNETRVGMREMGLPYESDPAVTRHLARFLGRQVSEEPEASRDNEEIGFPSAVLFNGGVMKSAPLRTRLMDLLGGWNGGKELREFDAPNPELAVALGAAYFGLARRGRGIRIRGGAARSYYIGVESSMPSVPGVPTPVKALCVAPFGMEEGTSAEMRGREFGLVVGESASFPLLASTVRKQDRAGEIIEDWSGEVDEVTSMETLLPASDADTAAGVVPIWLESRLTEIGTLEVWCVSRDGERRWKLEFNLRERQD